ncbi:MAG TPA: VCBS repeat-containing protein [Planctomycetaceae bacterium]|nr:VCBS repeat-containing protein [Planctomycetaceae bacterium]HIQ20953.1 VCBS repeat-containing protein [Planctomycetota bacterium]
MSWREILRRGFARAGGGQADRDALPAEALPRGEKIDFLEPRPIGLPFREPPKISNLQAVDLDQDGLLDVVVCDCETNRVSWIRQYPQGRFTEKVCAEGLIAPAHVQAVDFDDDGDLDLLVAVLGMLFPNNDKIGSVVILENDGRMRFVPHVVVERVARVSDVRGGDLDGDGDMDLAVAQFGYDDGQTRWIENLGGWKFRSHILQNLSGPIHSPVADMDGDGDLDIVVLVSQEWEEIYVFAGDRRGRFLSHRIYGSDNPDFGSSGMWLSDLDQDGDLDILYTNGDAFDYLPPHPWPWHGLQWLENQGGLRFRYHRLASFGGAVGLQPGDVDRDGDLDLVAVAAFNKWETPEAQSMIWLENDGHMKFRPRDITNTPSHIQALAAGDFNKDGWIDFVTGGMHVYPPYDRVERIVLWTNVWPQAGASE